MAPFAVNPTKSASASGEAHVIIATTEPAQFESYFADRLGASLFVTMSSREAISLLEDPVCDALVADFTPLADRWSGQRLLHHIHGHPGLQHVNVWLMLTRPQPVLEQYVLRSGGRGVVRRDPQDVALHIGAQHRAHHLVWLTQELDEVDSAFDAFAGPRSSFFTDSVRAALNAGVLSPSRQAYVDELASKLLNVEQRRAFLSAVADTETIAGHLAAGHGWLAEVHRIFRQYAGALGARIIISNTDAAFRGAPPRNLAYVEALAAGLEDAGHRASFFRALSTARLLR